jgi:hypothetical protein
LAKKTRKRRSRKRLDAQLVLFQNMFASLLLLQGVGQRNVADVVAINLNRVTAIAKRLNQKTRKQSTKARSGVRNGSEG